MSLYSTWFICLFPWQLVLAGVWCAESSSFKLQTRWRQQTKDQGASGPSQRKWPSPMESCVSEEKDEMPDCLLMGIMCSSLWSYYMSAIKGNENHLKFVSNQWSDWGCSHKFVRALLSFTTQAKGIWWSIGINQHCLAAFIVSLLHQTW